MNNLTTEERRIFAKENLSKGISVPRFRRTEITENTNKILLALLYSNDIKISEFAKYIEVDIRIAEKWVYNGVKPKSSDKVQKICKLLETSEDYLFSTKFGSYVIEIPDFNNDSTPFRMHNSGIKNPFKKVLYGLMWIYGINSAKISSMLEVSMKTVDKWIYTEKTPPVEYIRKFELLFEIPYYVLLKNYVSKAKI